MEPGRRNQEMRNVGMIAVAVVSLAGCTESHRVRGEPGAESVATELVDSAWMAGDMVTIGEFDADAFEIVDTWESEVELHVRGEDGTWAMTRLIVGDGFY